MQTIKELCEAVIAGLRPVVTFMSPVEDCESYIETNMRGRIVGARISKDDVVSIKVELDDFAAHNKPFESSTYYDKNGNPTLTAREAGYYNSVEELYLEPTDLVSKIMTIDSDDQVKLFEEFKAESADVSYVSWLESKVIAARKVDVDQLSNFIRFVDGNNSLGAGALAEKIAEYLSKEQL